MGRKIPGKKHKGVKDPEKQQAKRLAELEHKINAPPKNVDDQDIPKSLENFIKLKEGVKAGKIGKIKKKKKKKGGLICVGLETNKKLHPKAKPDKVVPVFQQKPGEKPRQFLYRVNKEAEAFINETKWEKKYGVQIKRNQITGKIEGLEKCEKDEIDHLEKLRSKHKNIKKKKKLKEEESKVKLSKTQKRKKKLELKKQKKDEEDIDEFKTYRDEIKFGEVAHEPPKLVYKARKCNSELENKPGKRDLLLKSIINEYEGNNKSDTIDRSGKRKNLPVGERRQLEKQQSDVIAAYRQMKQNLMNDR